MASSDPLSVPTPLGESGLTGDAEMSTAVILPIEESIPEHPFVRESINQVIDCILEWMTEMREHRCTRISNESRDEIIIRIADIKRSMMLPNTAIEERRKKEWCTELNYNLDRMQQGEYDRWHWPPPQAHAEGVIYE